MKLAAIDIGGTFTDCVVLGGGVLSSVKVPTTPPDLERGVLDALATAAGLAGQSLSTFLRDTALVLQGTTSALNTLLTRSGAKVGMLTTRGFRDIIETRRGMKPGSPYNIFLPPYEPLVPRELRWPVDERTHHTGHVVQSVRTEDVEEAASHFERQGVEAVAVCFLHAYLNPSNEEAARRILEKRLPDCPISLSSEVLPVWREYERFSTTVANAYVTPRLSRHLDALEGRLRESGFRGKVMLMTGGGLLQSPAYCARRAVHLLGSGPAGSANAALHVARTLGLANAVSIDMGGTSFDVCLIRNGQINTTSEVSLDGHRIALKLIDSESIGAGGGSIAWVDARGLLRVGPQSAGAVPGPACYGGGGAEPTVTDAALVLGYLSDTTFRWGGRTLDKEASTRVLARIGEPLGLGAVDAAKAVFETVNEIMANGIIKLTTRRGIDPRQFVLIAGGGAGAIHAAAIAERVGIARIVVPSYAGVYSAFGLLACDRGVESAQSHPCNTKTLDVSALTALYGDLETQAVEQLTVQGVAHGDISCRRTVDMRYVKQYHEVEVEVPAGPLTPEAMGRVVDAFHEAHRHLYTFGMPGEPVEFLTFRLRASAVSGLRLPAVMPRGVDATAAARGHRPCTVDGKRQDVDVYDGASLDVGSAFAGPALVEAGTTTIYVPASHRCSVDSLRNFELTHADGTRGGR